MSERMSRRTLMASAFLVGALGLTSCSADGAGVPGVPAASADGGSKQLRLAFLNDISTPDPDTAYDNAELNLVDNAYEGLLGYAPGQADPDLVGVLATKWSASPDNRVFTFTLREGVTFHDGTRFDSSAVAASFARRNQINEGPAYMTADVASVETPSPTEVVITLNQPNTSFLDLLASPFGPKMISPTALKAHPVTDGVDWFDTHDAGTGPFEYTDFQPGTSYQLTAFKDYWGQAPGYGSVRFDVLNSISTIQLQLESGDLDGLIGFTDPQSFARFSSSDAVKTYTFPSQQTPTLFVNPQSPELADQDTRVALLSGIDVPALAKTALGETAAPTTEVFPVNLLDPALDQQQIAHDPGALARLAAGPLGRGEISIAYAEWSPVAQALSDNLAAALNTAGIPAQTVGYPQGTYYPALEQGANAPDITFFTGFPDTANPDAWAHVFYTPGGGLDLFGASVPGVEDLLGQALRTGDETLYGEVARRVSASGYWYSVATSKGTAVFSPSVRGVESSYHPVITGVLDLARLSPGQ